MNDIVIDSDTIADLLSQYFEKDLDNMFFEVKDSLTLPLVKQLNKILQWYNDFKNEDSEEYNGLVVASTFAFIEVSRKFDIIVKDRFKVEQFAAFINSPPEWFFIAPLDYDLIYFLIDVPPYVKMSNNDLKPIEWTDAIHIATTFSRGNNSYLVTQDTIIRQVPMLKGRIYHK